MQSKSISVALLYIRGAVLRHKLDRINVCKFFVQNAIVDAVWIKTGAIHRSHATPATLSLWHTRTQHIQLSDKMSRQETGNAKNLYNCTTLHRVKTQDARNHNARFSLRSMLSGHAACIHLLRCFLHRRKHVQRELNHFKNFNILRVSMQVVQAPSCVLRCYVPCTGKESVNTTLSPPLCPRHFPSVRSHYTLEVLRIFAP